MSVPSILILIGIIGIINCIGRFNIILNFLYALYIIFGLQAFYSHTWLELIMNIEMITLLACGIVFFLQKGKSPAICINFFLFNMLGSAMLLLGFLASPFEIKEVIRSFVLSPTSLMKGGGLCIIGLCIKSGILFFASWILLTYSKVPPMGAFFLSSCTTKVAIYGLAKGFMSYFPLCIVGFISFAFFTIWTYCSYKSSLQRVATLSLLSKMGLFCFFIGYSSSTESINNIMTMLGFHIAYNACIFFLLDRLEVSNKNQDTKLLLNNKISCCLAVLFIICIFVCAFGLPGLNILEVKKSLLYDFQNGNYGIFIPIALLFIKCFHSDVVVIFLLWKKKKEFVFDSLQSVIVSIIMLGVLVFLIRQSFTDFNTIYHYAYFLIKIFLYYVIFYILFLKISVENKHYFFYKKAKYFYALLIKYSKIAYFNCLNCLSVSLKYPAISEFSFKKEIYHKEINLFLYFLVFVYLCCFLYFLL